MYLRYQFWHRQSLIPYPCLQNLRDSSFCVVVACDEAAIFPDWDEVPFQITFWLTEPPRVVAREAGSSKTSDRAHFRCIWRPK
jgi:hypothetical protein